MGEKTVDNQRKRICGAGHDGRKSLSALCRKYGISRPTGYKWLERYKGGETMLDRPHTPFRKPFKTSPDVELRIVDVRAAHPTWGARKIQRFLVDKGENSVPAASTINDTLKRNGCISELASGSTRRGNASRVTGRTRCGRWITRATSA